MNSRATRVARGWAVGVFATAAAALSHAVAGGGTPSGLALGVGVVFGGLLGTFALTTRPSVPRLATAVGATQVAFHLAFSTLGAAASGTAVSHVHDASAMAATAPAHAHSADPLMWVAHAIAGIVTLGLLRQAERAGWRMLTEFARLVVTAFRAPISAPLVFPRAAPVLASTRPARLLSRISTSAVSRRGPPLSVAF